MVDLEAFVRQIVREAFGVDATGVEHMTLGHSSQVYDVALPDRSVVVRLNPHPRVFAGTERNLATLRALGLPVPHVLACDLSLGRYPVAFVILNKIPGRDLRDALPEMTREELAVLAQQIVGFQRAVGALPLGTGFGYVPASRAVTEASAAAASIAASAAWVRACT